MFKDGRNGENRTACYFPVRLSMKKMHKIYWGEKEKVLLDRCPAGDGIWFDGGELRQVVEQYIDKSSEEGNKILQYLGESFKGAKK